jgi:hypothetical protein
MIGREIPVVGVRRVPENGVDSEESTRRTERMYLYGQGYFGFMAGFGV